MTMSPQEIQAKQFHVRFRGFDVEEVDDFLGQVAEHYLMLIEEKKTLAATVESLKSELDALKTEEHSFKDAIISAQRVADEMRQKSREEAQELLAKANDEVRDLKDAANKEITELEYRVDELRGTQAKLYDDLKQVIGTYLEQIEQTFVCDSSRTATVADASSVLETAALEDLEVVEDIKNEDDTLGDISVETEDAEADLGDLYEKIDLGADGETLLESGMKDTDIGSINLDEAGGGSIPDLDDEVMFTLEDPLDVEEIDVPIQPSKK